MKKTDKQEILEAIQGAEARSDRKMLEAIQGLDQKFSAKIDGVERSLSKKIDGVEQSLSKKIDGVEQNVTEQIGTMADVVHGIDIRLKRVEALMVTKDYLDIKFADQQIKVVEHVKERVSCWKERSILKTAN